MDRAFGQAQRKAQDFRRKVDPLTSVPLTADASGLDRPIRDATRKLTVFGNTSAEATLGADGSGVTSAVDRAGRQVNAFSGQSASATLDAEDAGVASGVATATAALGQVDGRTATARLDLNGTEGVVAGIGVADSALDSVDGRTATAALDADPASAIAKIRAYGLELDYLDLKSITTNVDADTLGASADLAAYQATASAVDAASDVHTTVDVDMGMAVTQLATYNTVAAASTTFTNVLGASFAFGAAQAAVLAAALVAAMASLGPLLGGLGIGAGLATGLGAGFGLLAGAAYVLAQGLYDGGAAMAALQERATLLQGELALALGPASLIIAEIGMTAMDVASNYMPMIGTAGTATALAAQAGLEPLFTWLSSQAGMGYFEQIFGSAAPIIGNVAAAGGSMVQALVAGLAVLVPYGVQLSAAIAGIAAQTAAWVQSAQGQAQITAMAQVAVTVFGALWNAAVGIGGALLQFATVAGADVATAISVLGTVVTSIIQGFTWLYETVGGAGVAFGLLAVAITPVVAAGFLATGAIAAFLAAAAPVAAVAAAIAVGATLIYNNWSTLAPIFSAVGTAISTGLSAGLDAVQSVGAAISAAWTAVWGAIGPTVTTALTTVLTFLQSLGTQIVTWWQTYFAPEGQMGSSWSMLWTNIQTVLSGALLVIQTIITTALTVISTLWNAVWPGLSLVLTGVWTVISSIVQGGITIILGIITAFVGLLTGNWQMAWDGVVMIVTGVWTIISGVVTGGLEIVLGVLRAGWGWLSEVTSAAWGAITSVVSAAWDGISSAVSAGAEYVSTTLSSWWATIQGAAQAAWDAVWSIIDAVWSSIYSTVESWITSVFDTLESWWSSISSSVSSWWDTIWSYIDSIWSSIYSTVESWVTSAYDTLESWWSSIYDSVVSWWDSAWSYVDSIWSSIYSTVESWVTSAYDTLESWWSSVYDSVVSWWDSVWTEIDSYWSSIYDTVASWADSVWTAIEDTWSGILDGASAFASSLYDALYTGFWDAVAVAGDALASLLEGIQSALDGIGIDIGIDVGGYAADIRSLTGAEDGYITAFKAGGVAAPTPRVGMMGSPGKNPKIHMWDEGMGEEGFVAKRGPRNRQIGILDRMAGWFGLGLVAGPLDDPLGSRHAARNAARGFGLGGIVPREASIPMARFQLGGTHYDWDAATQQIVNQVGDATGWCGTPNTYYGHAYIPGATENQSVDWWGGGRGGQLDISCGDSIWSVGSGIPSLTYQIWQGIHSSIGAFPEDPHYDHVHQTFAGGGGGGLFCKAVRAGFEAAAKLAKEAAHAIIETMPLNPPVEGVAKWGVDNAIDAVIQHVASLLPACGPGGGGGGDCDAIAKAAVEAMGWGDPACFSSLLSQESSCDCGAQNPSGASGVAQMMPSTFAAYDPGCGDIWDCHCNAMASLAYQRAVYGSPVCDAPYDVGGVIPGMGRRLVLAKGGERVLTARQNRALEALAFNPATGGSGAQGARDAQGHIDASQHNEVNVHVSVNSGPGTDATDLRDGAGEIAREVGGEVANVLARVNASTRANRHRVGRGFG
jgi:phage-related protein